MTMKVRVNGRRNSNNILTLNPMMEIGRLKMRSIPPFFSIEIDFDTILPREKRPYQASRTGKIKLGGKKNAN